MADQIDVQIDDGGLLLMLAVADKETQEDARKALRGNSLLVEGIIKSDMPVDTGRARASWGHWTPGAIANAPEAYKNGADESDAVWQESPDGMQITQGTNVPYVEDLNAGSSQQMGAGFIDDAAQTGAFLLIQDIERILQKRFG